ncbi:MAG: pentapeptide repeat-containing protein [Pseudonocardiaceae bacterium]
MEFRELAKGRSIQCPSIDHDELSVTSAGFKGEFDLKYAFVDTGEQAGVTGEGYVTHSVVRRVDLSGSCLGPVTLTDTTLEDVDLSNASVGLVIARRVEMLRCRAIGLRLSIELANDLYVEGCQLDFASINIEKVKGIAAFNGCSFRETAISGCLSDVVFRDCDFADTEFEAANAKGCDLQTSRLAGVRGLLSLRGALITAEQAVSVAPRLAAEVGLVVLKG